MRELAFLNPEVTIELIDDREEDDSLKKGKPYHYEGGLRDFVKYLDEARDTSMPTPIYIEGEIEGVPVALAAMQYNTSYTENVHSYVNNINTREGGTHVSGFRRALTRSLKAMLIKIIL